MGAVVSVSHLLNVNDITIHVREAGPVDGPGVLLIHGWPDSSNVWRSQIDALAAAGYHVIAPDLRGFGDSAKPDDIDSYNFLHSTADLTAVLDHFGMHAFYLCGHDWGAFFAWAIACFLPDRVKKLVAISVGHPTSFSSAGWEQKEKSWYMLWFQFPGVAETAFRANDWRTFRDFCRNHPDTDERIALLSRPGALTASLGIYRANIDPAAFGSNEGMALPTVSCPTIGVWSSGDAMLTEDQMKNSEQFVTGPWRYVRLEGGTHWVPTDHADELNKLLVEFFVD
jgi:pimeloyl-ACP methyl ester carboxylesterase